MKFNRSSLFAVTRITFSCVIALLLSALSTAKADPQGVFIPSYFYPGNLWKQATAGAASGVGGMIVNPRSGPGKTADKNYVSAVKAAQAAGIKVFGYVYTKYGTRPAADVLADVQKHINFYNVDGIFFDEVSSSVSALPYYQSLADAVHALPDMIVALNPGTHPAEGYMNVGDIIMTFEGTYAKYAKLKVPAWTAKYPATRFWHLIHTTPQSQLGAAIELSKSRNAGFVYVTDDIMANPYDTLPTYFSAELQAATAP